MYLPLTGIAGPGVSTCPGVGTGPTCQYGPNFKLLANVQNVVNDPSGQSPAPQDNSIFTYTVLDAGGNWPTGCTTGNPGCATYQPQAIALTQSEVQSQQINLAGLGYPAGTSTQSLDPSLCGAPSSTYPTVASACPADAIQSVSVDLQVAKPGTGANGAQEDNLVVYRYATSPGASSAPYQYSATVG